MTDETREPIDSTHPEISNLLKGAADKIVAKGLGCSHSDHDHHTDGHCDSHGDNHGDHQK
ncbi:hypothetical protein [Maridesulfovibrio sp.]|uniref:hypothetical protein n=1 Tax=Maridesulfovibrio sp. TaxID=2795000 RepID=UPI0039EE3C52